MPQGADGVGAATKDGGSARESPSAATSSGLHLALYCADCNLRFSDKAKLARHKKKFCVGTKYFDPQALHNSLHKSEKIKEMSFQDVKAYVQNSEVNPVIGEASLSELKDRFTASEAEWKNIRTDLVKKQQRQKVKELKQLKVDYEQSHFDSKQNTEKIMAMMQEIEQRTAEEQRQRLEVIKIKNRLEEVERKHVVALQAEKEAEIEQLRKERAALLAKEEALEQGINKIRSSVVNTEKQWQEQHQKEMAERLAALRLANNGHDDAKKAASRMLDAQTRELALQHGAKMAELKLRREKLEKEQAEAQAKVEAGVKIDDEDDALDGILSKVQRKSPKVVDRSSNNGGEE